MTTKPKRSKPGCHCNECREPFRRQELDDCFLCEACRKIPWVRGYQEPKTRGLRSGGPEYWEATRGQLNIVTDPEPPEAPKAEEPSDDPEQRHRRKKPKGREPTAWLRYREAVIACPHYTPTDKFAFMVLARYADYATGANCFPTHTKLATESGQSPEWWQKRLRRLRSLGLITTLPTKSRSGRWAANLYVFGGHGFQSPTKCEAKHLTISATNRPAPGWSQTRRRELASGPDGENWRLDQRARTGVTLTLQLMTLQLGPLTPPEEPAADERTEDRHEKPGGGNRGAPFRRIEQGKRRPCCLSKATPVHFFVGEATLTRSGEREAWVMARRAKLLEVHVEIVADRGDGAPFDGERMILHLEARGRDTFRVLETDYDRRELVAQRQAQISGSPSEGE